MIGHAELETPAGSRNRRKATVKIRKNMSRAWDYLTKSFVVLWLTLHIFYWIKSKG